MLPKFQKVHIAPLSEWCVEILRRDGGNFERMVGRELEIDISSMLTREQALEKGLHDLCEGPFWLVSDRSREETARVLGVPHVRFYVCRHLLAMD